ncbi:hypothetical protein DBR47_07465 [Paucibacter sp. KBW04]|uniref:hypothetical protein n=1 Tax=Paucibacter sp. KBW04 TaxID=2153361 RepID=UPI000F57CAD0|nr:hypothetical protein [Paucibacter sp. KBW04]RQO61316.1 hypothetical protein DBR47_07465 [Paucibacter sp. KBW04]
MKEVLAGIVSPSAAAEPPRELPADARRQAVAPIRGVIYQLWWSIDAWLRLSTPDEVIYLEGAEDFDKASALEVVAQQVKSEVDGISLNNLRALRALENFWTLRTREATRTVAFHYISTAHAVVEQDAAFGGIAGMSAWSVARENADMASSLQKYLAPKLSEDSALRAFLEVADAPATQTHLFRPVHWFLNQPGLDAVQRSAEDRVVHRLHGAGISLSYSATVCDRLYSFVSDVVVKPESASRILTTADLLRQIEVATTAHVAVPALQYAQFMRALEAGEYDPGRALLDMMKLEMPPAPTPLLNRDALVQRVRERIDAHAAVLLTGSVHKGKTTLAQLVGHAVCPEAWWFPLANRTAVETDNLLRALIAAMACSDAPSLVVIDNIDISPSAFSAFGTALSIVVSQAVRSERALLFTARGESAESEQLAPVAGLEVIDVPTMPPSEVDEQCRAHGCPEELAGIWGALICGLTQGHPKLVQVRIAELEVERWPAPTSADMVTASPAVRTARGTARSMLSGTVPAEVASFVYTASAATYPLSRKMLLALAQEIGGLTNGGDVIDSLAGKWFEQSLPGRLSVTPLLKGATEQVWTEKQMRQAHTRLFDAIASVHELDVSDASSLLFHAFIAKDGRRLLKGARIVETIDETAVAKALYQQLNWLPYVALEPGQRFFSPHAMVSVMLRQLQFTVASETGSSEVVRILERWTEEVAFVEDVEMREAVEVARCSRLVVNRNPLVPLRAKLAAICSLGHRRGKMADYAEGMARRFLVESREMDLEVPKDATTSQFYLSMHASSMRGLSDFAGLLDWLEFDADEAARAEFDSVLGWPLVSSCGAFVHGVWAAGCTERTDWTPVLALLLRAQSIASGHRLSWFGSEVARATSIVRSEHVDDPAGAMNALDEAALVFGETLTIAEQRVNVLFQQKDYADALDQWAVLFERPHAADVLDSFAYRRAAISACHLQRWEKAEELFMDGAKVSALRTLAITRFGLVVDGCRAIAMAGDCQRAARRLADVILNAPTEASDAANESWLAVLGATAATCKIIEDLASGSVGDTPPMAYGRASEPGLSLGPATAGQEYRALLVATNVGQLAAQLGDVPEEMEDVLRSAMLSSVPLVRFSGAQAMLAFELTRGARKGVISAVAYFERALNTMHCLADRQLSKESQPDLTPAEGSKLSNGGLVALFAAGAICTDEPMEALAAWQIQSAEVWGDDAPSVRSLKAMSASLMMTADDAQLTLEDVQDQSAEQVFGAAMVLLRDVNTPRATLRMHSLLASLTVCTNEGVLLQDTFTRALARRFAPAWKELSSNAFLFTSPRVSVPMLRQAVADVEGGRVGTKALLGAAAVALGLDPENYGSRIA